MAKFYGYNAPFLGGNQKVLSRQVDDRLIRNDLLQLLLTAPGERVMRPDWGSPVRPYLFQPITEVDISTLKREIREAIEQYERRVNVTEIVIDTDADNNLVNIKVYGFFQIDRFFNTQGGAVADADLLVELGISTSKTNRLG